MLNRVFDIFLSFIVLVIFSPLILVTSILVRINLGSPIFFTQTRVGKDNKLFRMIKFRTMTNATNKFGELLADEERLTNFGKFLRSTSIDELPEIINVLKGDMSLVGPRPLLEEYLPLYSEEQIKRHSVLPGITGWAQINGRNSISWCEKFDLDLWYVKNKSLLLDIKILFMTVIKVINRSDINQNGEATVEDFNGYN